ncbi:MAG: hypothetical protein GX430_08045 [Treponema sp.]|nr:hypothetical protein [Treponema sp.]
MSKHQTPNDQRANSMNPNNSAHKAGVDNRANQMNPNNREYKGGGQKSGSGSGKR